MAFRMLIPVFSALFGYVLFYGTPTGPVVGCVWGLTLGTLAGLLDFRLARVSHGTLFGALAGMALGYGAGELVASSIREVIDGPIREYVTVFSRALGVVVGLSAGAARGRELTVSGLRALLLSESAEEQAKVLDTSSIIDGRIADVCETGFFEGPFYVPQFILGELQHIADSSDPSKRTRGRRGLDVLKKLQSIAGLEVRIVEDDYPKIRDVDAKLIAFAKSRLAKVVTNDFNLNKVADVQGVRVLNINELSNALKPPVLPGDSLRVYVQKEGKEIHQGVAYLDDGTMVVVEQGRDLISRTVDVEVTSVLQTTAGRMIFAKPQNGR